MYILSNKEKAALITIARRARYDYLRKNDYTYLEDDIDMIDEELLISEENIEKTVLEKIDRALCASELEKIIKELLSIEDNEDTMIIDDLKSKSIFCYDGAKESTYELMC